MAEKDKRDHSTGRAPVDIRTMRTGSGRYVVIPAVIRRVMIDPEWRKQQQ
jgi:hypothetical protein